MSMEECVESVLLRYPGIRLEPLPGQQLCFSGNVRVEGTWFRISLRCPELPSMQRMRLQVQQGLRVAHFTAQTAGIQREWTFDDLIQRLPALLPVQAKACTSEPYLAALETASSNIYAEIAKLKCSTYKIHLNEACTRIRFSKFQHFEQHYLEVNLQPSLQLLSLSLPDCVPWMELFAKCGTIAAMLQLFCKHLEELREFYENCSNIDEMCYVVQPLQPSTKDNWRLFVLRERVFLKLIVADPFAPMSSMTLHIIGPTHEVEQLRRCYSEGLKDWDSELDIHKNLLRIFDLCFFPMPLGNGITAPLGMQHVTGSQFCNICYCHQMEGQVPIISCDNRNCSLIFHAACLREWFNTLSDGKVFLDVSFGTCPFCKAKLSTSFAELLTDLNVQL